MVITDKILPIARKLRDLMDWLFGYDFFISYAHADGKNYPAKMLQELERSGYHVFLDERVYTAGTDLKEATDRRLRMTTVVVVICRPVALASDWVRLEVERALQFDRTVVVIDVNESLKEAPTETARLLADRLHVREQLEERDDDPSSRAVDELKRSFSGVRQETKRLRVLVAALIAFMVIATVAAVAAVMAVQQRDEARRQTRLALAREYAARSNSQLQNDPQASLQLALGAMEYAAIRDSRLALINASEHARLRYQLRGHTGAINAVTFSHDGRYIATASDDGTARLWELGTGSVRVFDGHRGKVVDVQFSPDDKRLLTLDAGNVVLWNVDQGTRLATLPQSRYFRATFAPDGQTLATVSESSTRLWDAHTGSLQWEVQEGSKFPTGIAISPGGQWMAIGDWLSRVEVRSTRDGALRATLDLPPHPGLYGAEPVQFSPDGQWLLAATHGDRTPRVWSTQTWTAGRDLPNVGAKASFNPKLPLLLAIEPRRRSAEVWNIKEWTRLAILPNEVTSGVFSKDGRRLATVSDDGNARVWRIDSDARHAARLLLDVRQPDEAMGHVAFSPDARLLVTAGVQTAYVWDVTQGEATVTVQAESPVHAIRASPDGKHLAAVTVSGLRVWETRTWRELYKYGELKDYWKRGLDFSPDGHYLIAGGPLVLRIWDTRTWKMVQPRSAHPGKGLIRDPAFSPDGSLIAAPADGALLAIYRTSDWSIVDVLKKGGNSNELATFAPNGRVLFVAGPQTATVWEHGADGWAQKHDLTSVTEGVLSAQFDPSGNRLVTGGSKNVRIWDTSTWQPVRELRGHEGSVSAVRFSADGRWIAVIDDATARLWDAEGGYLLAPIATSESRLTDLTFSSDGNSIFTATEDGTVRVHPCSPCGSDDALIRHARSRTPRVIISNVSR